MSAVRVWLAFAKTLVPAQAAPSLLTLGRSRRPKNLTVRSVARREKRIVIREQHPPREPLDPAVASATVIDFDGFEEQLFIDLDFATWQVSLIRRKNVPTSISEKGFAIL